MKSLFFVAAVCGIFLSIESASEITSEPALWSNSSVFEFQKGCFAKIQNDPNVERETSEIKATFMRILLQTIRVMKYQQSLDFLNTMIDGACHPAFKNQKLYPAVMSVIKLCTNFEDPFTEEEKLIVEDKLRRFVCDLIMKSSIILNYSGDCLIHNPETRDEIKKCITSQSFLRGTPRDWIFSSPARCAARSKIINCANQIIKERCEANFTGRIESVLAEVQGIFSCDSELYPRSVNSL